MSNRNYLGNSYEVWNRQFTWFWFVTDQSGARSAIGVAASQADAQREARSLIEKCGNCDWKDFIAFDGDSNCDGSSAVNLTNGVGESSLASPERYITRGSCATD